MIAEVIGLAGAGKSSLRRALEQQGISTHSSGLSTRNPQNLPYFVGTGLRVLPMLIRPPRQGRGYSKAEIARLFYLTGMRPIFEKQARNGSPLLIDQGPIFELATLYAFGPERIRAAENRQWWQAMLTEWAATLDMIIWLDAPEEILIQRIRSRAKWHAVKEGSLKEMHEYLALYQSGYEHIIASLRALRPMTILSFNTSHRQPEAIASDILREMGHGVDIKCLDQAKALA